MSKHQPLLLILLTGCLAATWIFHLLDKNKHIQQGTTVSVNVQSPKTDSVVSQLHLTDSLNKRLRDSISYYKTQLLTIQQQNDTLLFKMKYYQLYFGVKN